MKALDIRLTVEQEFQLKVYETAIEEMSLEDARSMVLELTRQLMIKNNLLVQAFKGELR